MLHVLCALAVVVAGLTTNQTAPVEPQAEPPSLVAQYRARAVRTPKTYRAHRRLEAENRRFRRLGWIEASTALVDGRMTYAITGRGGSEMIQNRVLIPALEAERDLQAASPNAIEISDANYTLEDAAPDERGLSRIRLRPLRRDKRLLDGWLVLTPEADLVEVTGQLAKSPSFWTTKVLLTRRYTHIGDVRVPESVTSTAEVRIVGRSTFSMTFRFEEIDGVAVDDTAHLK